MELVINVDTVMKFSIAALSAGGWSKDPVLLYAAGTLQKKLGDALKALSEAAAPESDESKRVILTSSEMTIELGESERDAFKECVKFCIEQKKLPTGVHINYLLVGLGFVRPDRVV